MIEALFAKNSVSLQLGLYRKDRNVAKNFRIFTHRNGGNLHLKLMGDFDGTSAHELLNTLKKGSAQVSRIFIHTNPLKNIHPFGLSVFHDNLGSLKDQCKRFIFTGHNAAQFESAVRQFQ